MSYYFTSESVSEGHPDKVADQISDALLDNFLAQDPHSKVACETLVTTGLTVLSGEVKTDGYVDVQKVAREVIRKIGYVKSEYQFDADSCGVISAIHEQSAEIRQGVVEGEGLNKEQGAGDQGMMFGYATNETENLMPLALDISHKILIELAAIRKAGTEMTYLRPDSKSQVTLEYNDDHTPKRITDIVVSTQHDDFADEKPMQEQIEADVRNLLIPKIKTQLSKEWRENTDAIIEELQTEKKEFDAFAASKRPLICKACHKDMRFDKPTKSYNALSVNRLFRRAKSNQH